MRAQELYVTDFLRIRMADVLERMRLEDAPVDTDLLFGEDEKVPPFVVNIAWRPERRKLAFRFYNGWQIVLQYVQVILVASDVHVHKYFGCPLSGVRCRDLYFVDGEFGSRTAFNLTHPRSKTSKMDRLAAQTRALSKRAHGEDGRGPARGAQRQLVS